MITAITNNRVQNRPAFKSGKVLVPSTALKKYLAEDLPQKNEFEWLTKITFMLGEFTHNRKDLEKPLLHTFTHADGTVVKMHPDRATAKAAENVPMIEIILGNQTNAKYPEKIQVYSSDYKGDNATQMNFFDSVVALFMEKTPNN